MSLKGLLLAGVFIGALLLGGCGEGSQEEAAVESPEQTTTQTATQEETTTDEVATASTPEEAMTLQYEYINSGDFDKAYSLFAKQSQQEISLEQYRRFYEANARVSVTDYSFPSVQIQDDSATVESVRTVNNTGSVQQVQTTQQLVRENEGWRVVMRPEQLANFSLGTGNPTELAVGETATLPPGDTVTVYSYEVSPSLNSSIQPNPGYEFSAIDVEICASPNDARIDTPANFYLHMPDNTRLQASWLPTRARAALDPSSNLPAGDCLRGYVGFEEPQGQEPDFVLFEGRDVGRLGSEIVKWTIR